MRSATYASVTVAFILILIKIFAYVLTGSVALLSSLIDSILDSFASILNLVAVRHALTPADRGTGGSGTGCFYYRLVYISDF